MKATLLIAVALTTVALCSAADPECKYRRIRGLALHWANPTECTRYFRCTNKNVMREIVCAEGKVYNANTGRCTTNEPGLCKLTLLAPLIEPLNPCADEVSGAYLPQTGYCRNFYICNDNKAYAQACEAGSFFNATSGNCLPDTDTECWQNKCLNETDGTYLADASSCASFYVCANGEAVAQNCGNGSYFNSTLNICQPDATGQYCWENLCFGKSDGDFVKNNNDCNSYYVCASGAPIKQSCPEGSYFNSLENSCVPGVCPTESSPTTTTACPEETTTACVQDTTTACPPETTTACAHETTTQCIEVTTDCSCPGGYKNGQLIPLPNYAENCDKYYVCIDGRLEERECGKGNRFDENLGACVPDTDNICKATESTDCPEVVTPTPGENSNCPGGYTNGELIPFPNYPQNCDKYYVCVDGTLQERECGIGNRFDAKLGTCVPDTNNICWPTEATPLPGVNTPPATECPEVVTPTPGENCNCPGGYTNGELIPFPNYPQNCDKYYVCVDGTLQERECGIGNRFDAKLGTCVPDTNNICWPTEATPLPGVNTPPATECPEVVTPTPGENCNCPGGYTNGELIPFPNYPQNCDKYYVCVDGTLQERECGIGNRFDAKLGTCVPDTNNICWPTEATPLPGVNTPPATECPEVVTPTPGENCNCPGGYTNGELIPFPNYPQNCDKYYVCVDGTLQERECGIGNRFDAKLGTCVPDTNNICWPTEATPLPGVNTPPATECPEVVTPTPGENCNCPGGYTNGELIPFPNYPQNCDKYYVCVDGTLQERECGIGNRFDAKLGTCVPDTNNICWPTEATPLPGVNTPPATECPEVVTPTPGENCNCPGGYTNGELIPFPNYPQNCDKYYVCVDGTLQERECGIGNRFDAKLGTCVPDTNNICWPTEATPLPGVNTPPATECPEVVTPTPGENCNCPGGYTNGELIPFPNYPQNCDKYYVCVDGTLQERECGIGNRFDAKLGTCVPDTNNICWPTEATPLPGVNTPPATECPEVVTPTPGENCNCPGGYTNGELIPFPNYPQNCDKYYVCVDGTLQERECGIGNRFDAKLGTCVPDTNNICWPTEATPLPGVNTPPATECPEVVTPTPGENCNCPGGYTNGELIPFPNYPQNCDKYYVCVDGTLQERECGIGNRFDAKLGTCVPDTNNICWPTEATPLPGVNTPPATECPEVVTPTPGENCNCPGGYTNGELIPFPNYPQNCDKYYVCVNGTLQERECGIGNRFDAKLGTCVPDTNNICWPTEATPSAGGNTPPIVTECPEVVTPTVTDGCECTEATTLPTVTDCTCPGGYTDGELLPFPNYPENCDKYYICTNGRLEERECGIGNRFDSSLGVCVPDAGNVCWPNVCNGQPDGTTVADSINCTTFYLCEGGKGEIYECPADKWFDPVHQVCVADINATCINPCKDTTGIMFLPNPDCSKYFLCNDGQPFVETCPSGGFDVNLGKCDDNAVCEATLCVGIEDGTTFPVVGNDTMFYLCLGGVPQIDECTPGHVYNAAVGVCFKQPSPDCDQSKCNSTTPEEGAFAPLTNIDDTAFCLCRNGGAFLHHCTDNYTFRADLGICYSNAPCDPEICDIFPENTRSQNRNDTQSFCLCVSKVQVIVECPNNQTYNPVSQLCQSPDDKCSAAFCFSAPDYTIFPALNNNTNGFCMCLNSDPVYKSCESGTQFDIDKNICLSTTTEVCNNALCVGNSGLIFGITGDPHSFCYCTGAGIANKQSCPNSEIFNETLMICQAVGCDGQVCLTNPSEPFPTDNDPYSFCICSSTDPISVTKHTCQNGTRFDPFYLICKQDPCDKSVCTDLSNEGMAYGTYNYPQDFCVCTNGVPVLHNCPIGSLFNSTMGICAPATNSQCDLSACANASSENVYPVPAKSDTHGFCYCFSPTVVEFFSCPDEALFDPIRGICDIGMPEIPNTPANTCTCPGGYTEGQILPNPTNCRLYYICCNGQLKEFDCGAGNFFDKVTFSCQPLGRSLAKTNKQLMRSEPIPEDNKPCVENEKHAVASNCSQYEICIDGIWIRLSCPNAWYYNAEQHKCMEPRDDTVCAYARVKHLPLCTATMEERTVASKTTNCAQYYRCIHGKWHLSTCSMQHYYAKRLNTCIPSLKSDLCAARNEMEIEADIAHSLNVTSSNPQCQHMAVRPHEHNCAMYIMCLEGRWWYQYCTLGMYFNSTYNYCMPNTDGQCAIASNVVYEANSTQKCNLPGSMRPTLLTCDRYYECRAGYWQLRSCDSHQYFNATSQMCLPDTYGVCAELHSTNCTEGERREFPLNCTAYQICIRGVWQRASCNPFWAYDNTLQVCVPNDGICADNGLRQVCSTGNTRAHPLSGNCTQFYYCLNEIWVTLNCLKGHFYQKELDACVPHAEHDKCQPMSTDLGMQQEIGRNPSVLCVGREDGSAVSHPDSCHRFFVCIAEMTTNEQKCVKGSYFDAKLGYCRPNDGECVVPLRGVCANATDGEFVPHVDDCRAYYHCSTLNGTELLYCAEGYYFQNSTHECRIDNGECRSNLSQSGKCAGSWEHGKQLPHERYCNIYYACVRGLAIPVACPAEHEFNVAVGHCVYNASLECENGTMSDVLNSTKFYSCANFTEGTHLPVITDCTKYLVCSPGLELMKNCPSGTFFDAEQRLCLPDDGSCPYVVRDHQPSNPDPTVCEGEHGLLLPNLNNCNEFYVCINGKLHEERCYVDQYFDSTKNQCVPYKFEEADSNKTETALEKVQETKIFPNMQCNDKPINNTELCARISDASSIAEQGDCRRYISCNELAEPISQRCRNGESFDSLLGVCRQNDGTCLLENGQRVGECNGRHGQLVRDVDNCRGYFVCINGQKISKECGEHELFDKNLSACQEDVNNVCGESTIQSNKLQTVSCIGLNNSTLYPYTPDNCRSYFQCINGSSIVHECADGLFFNATLRSCVKDITECSMPTVTLKRVPDLTHLKICGNAIIGQRYANVSDNCRSFFICEEDGNIESTKCPTGELYNSESGACEISENVVC